MYNKREGNNFLISVILPNCYGYRVVWNHLLVDKTLFILCVLHYNYMNNVF